MSKADLQHMPPLTCTAVKRLHYSGIRQFRVARGMVVSSSAPETPAIAPSVTGICCNFRP